MKIILISYFVALAPLVVRFSPLWEDPVIQAIRNFVNCMTHPGITRGSNRVKIAETMNDQPMPVS